MHDTRFVEREREDYAPSPETAAHTATVPGGTGLRADDASETARATALAMVQALLDADAPALQRLFAERVVFGMEGFGRPRAELVDRCVEETRALAFEPDLRPDSVVDVNAIEVRTAEQFHERVALPPGIKPSDLLVTLPPRNLGQGPRSRIACVGTVYVRVGARTEIVGMLR